MAEDEIDAGSNKVKLGSGNYLNDRGYADPAEARTKFLLANEIALVIEDRKLSQLRAAELTGLKQPDISRISNGNVTEYSVWRLMRTLSLLGKNIVIGIDDAEAMHGEISTKLATSKRMAGTGQ